MNWARFWARVISGCWARASVTAARRAGWRWIAANPDRPEEFPIFTDWWLGKPQPDDKELHLFAMLDSVSCTGAYEFHIRPGETTVADIEAVIFLRETNMVLAVNPQRKPLATIGLAPLTSMFWFGENSERKFDDYRPEVHDSDGLLMHMENGEVLWRPLNNAIVMRHQRFGAPNIRGFGLLQRDRDFANYQDIFNRYDLVPSVWVEPRGRWGEGDVHLRRIEHALRGAGQHRGVLGTEDETGAAAAVSLQLHAALDARNGHEALARTRSSPRASALDPRNPQQRQFVD